MDNKKIVNSLVKHLVNSDLKLIPFRTFLALSQGGITQMCPESNSPCNSSCIFFNLSQIGKESKIRVVISCQSTNQHFASE